MTDKPQTKERAPRTPRNYQSILNGSLSLPLNEKVALIKALKEDVQRQVDEATKAAEVAKQTVNGL